MPKGKRDQSWKLERWTNSWIKQTCTQEEKENSLKRKSIQNLFQPKLKLKFVTVLADNDETGGNKGGMKYKQMNCTLN